MNQNTELFPYFQPIIAVASAKIIGYEALARKYDEENKPISAGSVFSCSETDVSQLITWDRNVRRLALEKFSHLQSNSLLSLNISSAWIDYVIDLKALPTLQMIDEFKINRNRIIIEITETQDDIEKLAQIVKIYRHHGLKVAIDDFGAGFSQLERVMAIRPDIIKIDMRLFKQASKEGIASDVVHLLTQLCKRTGCRIVCEGIETDDEFIFGLSCGAQFLQGYLFSQAEAEFQAELSYEKHISSLRDKFVSRSVQKQEQNIIKINSIKSLVLRLKQCLEHDFNLNDLVSWDFEETGILRFYLCNNKGIQTSPNFNFSNKSWFTDSSKVEFNWSWRPYFYHLLALENTGTEINERFVSSERYKDFDTDQICKTFSLRLDNDRILLVDIKADWV